MQPLRARASTSLPASGPQAVELFHGDCRCQEGPAQPSNKPTFQQENFGEAPLQITYTTMYGVCRLRLSCTAFWMIY